MCVNLNNLISNSEERCKLYTLSESEPPCQINSNNNNNNNNMFFYLSKVYKEVGDIKVEYIRVENINIKSSEFMGGIANNQKIEFYRHPFLKHENDEIIAKYYNKYKTPLIYMYVPNYSKRGVSIATVDGSKNENHLISSGQLSGCTVCSLYMKEINSIYFFHVGKSNSVDKNPYTQDQKNVDLYNAIAFTVKKGNINMNQLTDEQLLDNLCILLNEIQGKVQINIFIRKEENNQCHLNCESASLKTNNSNIYLRYYTNYAQMLATMCINKLYSVHYYVANNIGVPYDEVKRKNYKINH